MRTALDYHATAAINILNLRGPDQFKSADAVRLLVQFRTFIVSASCLSIESALTRCYPAVRQLLHEANNSFNFFKRLHPVDKMGIEIS